MQIGYTVANTSLGKVLVGTTERGVSAVYLGESERSLVESLHKEYPKAEIVRAAGSHEEWLKEIVQRVEGNAPSIDPPLDFRGEQQRRTRKWRARWENRAPSALWLGPARRIRYPSSCRAIG